VEHDLFDFLLLSLPDNDWHSHKRGPEAQVDSIALADQQLARVADAAGGLDVFLAEHAVVVMADHSQAAVTASISLQDELAELGVLAPPRAAAGRGARQPRNPLAAARSEDVEPRIAVCPSQRAAMVYALHEPERDAMRASVTALALALDGVDLVMWLERDAHEAPREGVIAGAAGELRFAPGGPLRDARGCSWRVEGELDVLGASASGGLLETPAYPDALSRVWAALLCPNSGEVLLSAAPGHEFLDWGRQAHVGGGSHGSLHASDSLGALLMAGVELPAEPPAQWAIRDVAGLILAHFGVAAEQPVTYSR
ncbi:MAG: alkaline phosphatase family protein, partial [Solirubrobacteraceae bacterium]